MNALAVATLLVAVACANAGGLGLGLGLYGGINGGAILAGPSGIVSRSGLGVGIVGPIAGHGLIGGGIVGVPAITANAIGLHGGLIGASPEARALAGGANLALAPAGLNTLITPAGSGLEGQWVPDINEKLHEDGSYKPEIYGL